MPGGKGKMNRIFKKFLSVVLAFVMYFSFSAQSAAASSMETDILDGIRIRERRQSKCMNG